MTKHIIYSVAVLVLISFQPSPGVGAPIEEFRLRKLTIKPPLHHSFKKYTHQDTVKIAHQAIASADSSGKLLHPLAQNVKRERVHNKRKMKQAHKYYNPFKFLYSLLGL